ncbi:MAG: V-type ATP synthase subunit A, partial [Candidatus Omnitrophota bacterium]|nr:V-type ATP synthase subunit A [Candidatus Omnitrophota bacterium]
SGETGSVTIGGAVSPAGGNFEEPVTQATLKVVGAFHGLSRDRANARRYPAIDPLDSWSKYTSFIDAPKAEAGRAILHKSHNVDQMMKVVGEEGTSIDEFVAYLKGEFLDAVYLQQNAFDKTDEATPADRQRYVYDLLGKIIGQEFRFDAKDAARRFFQDLRQIFINWNSTGFQSPEFREIERQITEKISAGQTAAA